MKDPDAILNDYETRPRALTEAFIRNFPWDQVRKTPLSPDLIPVLRYMRDIETLTEVYFEELRGTPTFRERRVRAFMEHWREEEAQHGILLNRFLEEAGIPSEAEWANKLHRQIPRRYRIENSIYGALTRLAGKSFSAVHLLWGAINEMSTLQGYRRLSQVAGHPLLSQLLKGIMQEEAVHIYFYFNMGNFLLESSALSKRLARWVIDRFWKPVGTGIRPEAETQYVMRLLFGDMGARRFLVEQIEGKLQKLSGFAGFRAVGRVMEKIMEAA